ncbi:MAG TPA: C25 family cysteine peptidase, partial [Verrucomicrobiae bacterium]
MPTNKLIVTNLGALKIKYADGWPRIQAGIDKLIAADANRGLTTALIGLDDDTAMASAGASPVTNATDPKQNKNAIDALYNKFAPDYMLILGAGDIVPHQDLANPVYSGPEGDPDSLVFSDLPYSCSSGYGTQISDFKNPTRVVGRLPDVDGVNDPAYLEKLLDTAASYASVPAANYAKFFGVSAGVWTGSTSVNLQAIFGTSGGMKTVPPNTYQWPQNELDSLSHFFNCHGAPSTPQYFGQPSDGSQEYPVAEDAAYIRSKIKKGTVVAAECCYGAELYNPNANPQQPKPKGIPNQYLEEGAFGFFGSTTVAYGPVDTNDWADLICQYFFKSLLNGASLGRAALEARQTYILNKGHLTGTDLKTLAQYLLLGDPSVTPVKIPAPSAAHLVVKAGAFVAADSRQRAEFARTLRRRELIQNGLAIAASASTSEKKKKTRVAPKILDLLKSEAAKLKLSQPQFASFEVAPAAAMASAKARIFKSGRPKSAAFLEAVPIRTLKAVHQAIGKVGKASACSVNLAGFELLEFEDGVTIRNFVSR